MEGILISWAGGKMVLKELGPWSGNGDGIRKQKNAEWSWGRKFL